MSVFLISLLIIGSICEEFKADSRAGPPRGSYIFLDASYYSPQEFERIERIASKLEVRAINSGELRRLLSSRKPFCLILFSRSGDSAPDVIFDPDRDGEIYDQSLLWSLPYTGVSSLPSDVWWQGPPRRSFPLEWLFTVGSAIIWCGEGLPARITYPGPKVKKPRDLELQRCQDGWLNVSFNNVLPYNSKEVPHRSNFLSKAGKILKLKPVFVRRGVRLSMLEELGNEILALSGFKPQRGESLLDTFIGKVGSGHLIYIGWDKNSILWNLSSLLEHRPWEKLWVPMKVEIPFDRRGLSPRRGFCGGGDQYRVLIGDLSSFGENTLLLKLKSGEVIDLLSSSNGCVFWNGEETELSPNGNFRMVYSFRGTHMNAEENLFQWIRVFTEQSRKPKWLCVNHVFPFHRNALLYIFEFRPSSRGLREFEFEYTFELSMEFKAERKGRLLKLSREGLVLFFMPVTGNFKKFELRGGEIKLRFKQEEVKGETAFGFVLVPSENEREALLQLSSSQRFAVSHIPSVYRNGLIIFGEEGELKRWKWLVSPTPCELKISRNGHIELEVKGVWPWLPETEGNPVKRDILILVEPRKVLKTLRSGYENALDLVGKGFRGTGRMLLEFDHYWIPESPTVEFLLDWFRLTGDRRLLEMIENIGRFLHKDLLTPCGDYWRRMEAYGLAYDFCSAKLLGGLNELYGFEATGDPLFLKAAVHSGRFCMRTSPFSEEGFSDFAYDPLGADGAFLYRDFPVRAENVAYLSLMLLKLYRFTGKEHYLKFAGRALDFLMNHNQRGEAGYGFCAVWLDARQKKWGVDDWFGPHTIIPSLEALCEGYRITREKRYLDSALRCLEGWVKPRLFGKEGKLLFGENPEEPYGLEFTWVGLGRRLFMIGALSGKRDLLDLSLELVHSAYERCLKLGLYDPKSGGFSYPEYNGQFPAQSFFHVPLESDVVRLKVEGGKVEVELDLPKGGFVLIIPLSKKPREVSLNGMSLKRVGDFKRFISESQVWFWHDGDLVLSINLEGRR